MFNFLFEYQLPASIQGLGSYCSFVPSGTSGFYRGSSLISQVLPGCRKAHGLNQCIAPNEHLLRICCPQNPAAVDLNNLRYVQSNCEVAHKHSEKEIHISCTVKML